MYIASPDHWHALQTIMACQAGKDVYCEKPACNTIEEGRAMVTAAERYGRVVQIGSQGRSQPAAWQAANYIRGGRLGKVSKVTLLALRQPGRRLDAGRGAAAGTRLRHVGGSCALASLQRETHARRVPLDDRFRRRPDSRPRRARDEHRQLDHGLRPQQVRSASKRRASRRTTACTIRRSRWKSPTSSRIRTGRWFGHSRVIPSKEIEARYGAVYHGENGTLTVTLGDGAGTGDRAEGEGLRRSVRLRQSLSQSRPQREFRRLHPHAREADHAHGSRRIASRLFAFSATSRSSCSASSSGIP